jgi:stage V sporulation protein G
MIEDAVFDAFENELKSMGESLSNLKRQKSPGEDFDE